MLLNSSFFPPTGGTWGEEMQIIASVLAVSTTAEQSAGTDTFSVKARAVYT